MRIAVVGGGPAGLYAALLLKRSDPEHSVRVIEKNPEGATYGWGVVFSDRTLSSFREADIRSYERIMDELVIWDRIEIRYRDTTIRIGGQVFSGIARRSLLAGLVERCRELDVEVNFETEVSDPGELADEDLVVGADGVHSIFRNASPRSFRTSVAEGRARYIWFGTDYLFDCFTFMFEQNEHGLFQVHAYPFDGARGTFIVETDGATWSRAGLDRASETDSIAYCEELSARQLKGRRLLSNQSKWVSFPTIRNRAWVKGNVGLLGDAAHTAHFSIGSGTKLAMEDAIALAGAIAARGEVPAALAHYELERRPRVERLQEAARQSQTYFENTHRYVDLDPVQFAFHLMTRSGRVDYNGLRLADPGFVADVDRWFLSRESGCPVVAPPPALVPLDLGAVVAPNRVVVETPPTDDAIDGYPSTAASEALAEAARLESGIVVTEMLAISEHARITPGSAGLYSEGHATSLREILAGIRPSSGSLICAVIGHSGPRGSSRPSRGGLDRPLRDDPWPTLAASAVPYAPGRPPPVPMDGRTFREVIEDLVAAARSAIDASFDGLFLEMAGGYLLASFLSPLTNHREDAYGMSPEGRRRFPLEAFAAVRETWPSDRLLGASLTVHDGVAGGVSPDEVAGTAAALGRLGCDVVVVRTGRTIEGSIPRYDRFDQMMLADRIRRTSGLPVIATGRITSADDVNTIVASGRADMCLLLR